MTIIIKKTNTTTKIMATTIIRIIEIQDPIMGQVNTEEVIRILEISLAILPEDQLGSFSVFLYFFP